MFARDVATSTGYVPDALMAAPLAHRDRVLGVLEVLDPVEQSRSSLSELDLLALFARQAAAALAIVTERRREETAPEVRARGLELVEALRDVLLDGMSPAGPARRLRRRQPACRRFHDADGPADPPAAGLHAYPAAARSGRVGAQTGNEASPRPPPVVRAIRTVRKRAGSPVAGVRGGRQRGPRPGESRMRSAW